MPLRPCASCSKRSGMASRRPAPPWRLIPRNLLHCFCDCVPSNQGVSITRGKGQLRLKDEMGLLSTRQPVMSKRESLCKRRAKGWSNHSLSCPLPWSTKLHKSSAGIAASSEMFISTESSTTLNFPSNSIDYIFTDPPYSWKVQFGEANFVWESWLGFDNKWHEDEIIVNEVREKTVLNWKSMMHRTMAECYRVLKPGRWMSLCYHDTSEGTWALMQDIMADIGFISDKFEVTIFIDTAQKSWKQNVADKIHKRDLVINFRKPKPDELVSQIHITRDEAATTFSDKALAIIREYLTTYPGATKDRIYDEVVSR